MTPETNKKNGYILVRSVVMITSCLIVLGVVLLGLKSGRANARDEQRIRDVANITKALGVYSDYNQRFPESQNGRPKDLGTYLEFWPTAPARDGTCTKEANDYYYESFEEGRYYHLSFCLGNTSNDYPAGFNTVGPKL